MCVCVCVIPKDLLYQCVLMHMYGGLHSSSGSTGNTWHFLDNQIISVYTPFPVSPSLPPSSFSSLLPSLSPPPLSFPPFLPPSFPLSYLLLSPSSLLLSTAPSLLPSLPSPLLPSHFPPTSLLLLPPRLSVTQRVKSIKTSRGKLSVRPFFSCGSSMSLPWS